MKEHPYVDTILVIATVLVASISYAFIVQAQLTNPSPIVDAGPDKTGEINTLIFVSGSATDDGLIAVANWEIDNQNCSLTQGTTENFDTGGAVGSISVSAEIVCTVAGSYTATLHVQDIDENLGTDSVILTITDPAGTSTLPICGNGIVEEGEECDELDLQGLSCASFEFEFGTLGCTELCVYDTSNCAEQQPPAIITVDAGPDVNKNPGQTVELSGFASVQKDGGVSGEEQLFLNWIVSAECSQTQGSTEYSTSSTPNAELLIEATRDATVVCDEIGIFIATLYAQSANAESASDSTKIRITDVEPEPEECGNGIIEGDEQCDTGEFNNKKCTDFGFDTGKMRCSDVCRYDVSECTIDDTVNDNTNTNTSTNTNTNTDTNGNSNTNTNTSIDGNVNGNTNTTIEPEVCGNNIIENNEECDSGALRGRDCADFGYSSGELRCTNICTFDTSSCESEPPSVTSAFCGDGVIDKGEECDGTELQGATCVVMGFTGGTVSCTSDCRVTTETCTKTSESTQEEELIDDYLSYCLEFDITDSAACQTFLSYDLNPACKDEGIISPQACEDFLHRQYYDELCRQEGIALNADCDDILLNEFVDELYCGDLTDDACQTLAEERLLTQIVIGANQREEFVKAIDANLGQYAKVDDVLNIIEANEVARDVFPLDTDADSTVHFKPSVSTIDVSSKVSPVLTAPYVIILDNDSDGLPNDLELLYGTDLNNADSDNDGFNDSDEILSGFDPLLVGGEKTGKVLSSVETAIISDVPLEQPIRHGEVSESYVVKDVSPTEEDPTDYQLTGVAEPNTFVFIYIYSQMPLVLAVKTDAAGNWVYTLKDNLIDGKHTAYVAVTSETGKIVDKSEPFTFFVERAQAVTVGNFLTDETLPDVEREKGSFLTYYIFGGVSIVFIGLVIIFLIYLVKGKRDVGI